MLEECSCVFFRIVYANSGFFTRPFDQVHTVPDQFSSAARMFLYTKRSSRPSVKVSYFFGHNLV